MRITPRPSNLGESREILRLLSQFGEVEYFKNLKYDALSAPNTALVIYKDESAANECLKRSPIRFRMGKATVKEEPEEDVQDESNHQVPTPSQEDEAPLPRGPVGTPFGLGSPTQVRSMSTSNSSLPRPPRNSHRRQMPFEARPQPPELSESRIFQIQTNPSSRHFRDQINVNHYHGSFAIDSKMVGQFDLAKKVPTLGLSCVEWKTMDKPWHVVRKEKSRDEKGPMARKRLSELWEEGRKDRAENGEVD